MKSVSQAMNNAYGGIPEKKLIKKGYCKECEEETETYEMAVIGGPEKGKLIKVTYGCQCENRKLAESAKQVQLRIKQKKLLEYFNLHSLINKDLLNASFDKYKSTNKEQAYAKKVAMRYVDVFEPEKARNVSFHGGYGVGKSHLSKCIADGVMERGYSVVFITVPTLLRKLRSTYNKDAEISEDKIFSVLEKIDLLILDDIGAEKESDWTVQMLFDLINARQGMSTIYTSNYSPDDLKRILGSRIHGRMFYNTEEIEIRADNYRVKDKTRKI